MSDLWSVLTPLVIGSAVVPIQIIITILLLRSPGGLRAATAWVAGMTAIRLLQGLFFRLVFSSSGQTAEPAGGPGPVVSALLLVMAVVFYVTALRQILAHDDEDAPPPKWMAMTASMTPGRAFLIGASYARGAELLFQVLTEREEKSSIGLASNLPFSEWGQIINDARLVAAVIDRVTFNAHIIETGTESYRHRTSRNRPRNRREA